jgi:hypothetical protein
MYMENTVLNCGINVNDPTKQQNTKSHIENALQFKYSKKSVWLTITTTCSKFQTARAETTESYLEKYKSTGNKSAKNYQTTYSLCNTP